MHIVILGAGVIGTTSAYYLRQAGHEVTVIDRQHNVALETSFANAGQISPGYASPWAAPGIPLKAFKGIKTDYLKQLKFIYPKEKGGIVMNDIQLQKLRS